ncbi:MAG: cytochrome c [Myxococcales bacterium]|nr:cytochrome c [Myxococcales bacterium]
MSKLRVSALVAPLFAVLVACGGSKPKAKPPADPAPTAAPAEPAKPAEPPKPTDEMLAASALAEQYATGKEVYAKACASCHGDNGEGNPKNPPLVGDKALPEKATFAKAKLRKKVAFKTAGDVFAFVKAKMPIDKPASLSDDEYLAAVAWFLNENKVALDKKLDAENAATIKLR